MEGLYQGTILIVPTRTKRDVERDVRSSHDVERAEARSLETSMQIGTAGSHALPIPNANCRFLMANAIRNDINKRRFPSPQRNRRNDIRAIFRSPLCSARLNIVRHLLVRRRRRMLRSFPAVGLRRRNSVLPRPR